MPSVLSLQEETSEYEEERDARIARNQAFLVSLGLGDNKPKLVDVEKNAATAKKAAETRAFNQSQEARNKADEFNARRPRECKGKISYSEEAPKKESKAAKNVAKKKKVAKKATVAKVYKKRGRHRPRGCAVGRPLLGLGYGTFCCSSARAGWNNPSGGKAAWPQVCNKEVGRFCRPNQGGCFACRGCLCGKIKPVTA